MNDWLQANGVTSANLFQDPIDVKTAVTNSQTAGVGEVAVFDWSIAANATADQKKYGHVGIVTAVDANGKPTRIADWNWSGDGKFQEHPISAGNASCIK